MYEKSKKDYKMKKKQIFDMNKKWRKFRLYEQQALYPIRIDMQVDFTDNETTEKSFIEDIEKAIQGVIDTSGVNVTWTVNDDSMG